jgi:hypothetical protein
MTVMPQPPSPLLPLELDDEPVRLIPLELLVVLAALVVPVAWDAEGTPLDPPVPLPPKPAVLPCVALQENVATRAVGDRNTSPVNARASLSFIAR